MIGKQIIIDILAVIALPVLIIGAYFIWFRADDSALLSADPTSLSAQAEPGAKTKRALDTLKGLALDNSLFTDPAYTSLESFPVTIPSASTSRKYPFILPPIIEERIRQSKMGHGPAKPSTSLSASTSSKIDQLKNAQK